MPQLLTRQTISFEQLQTIVANLPTDRSDVTIKNNLSLIDRVAKPESIIPMLEHVMNDGNLLADIACRSYRHVNHFDKIVLIDSLDLQGYRLTLHLWNPPYTEKELTDELIHDHRFSFWSNILTGTLVCENFMRAEIGSVFRRYQYTPEKQTISNFYTFMGEEIISKSEPSKHLAGESYYLSYETIHRVILPRTNMTCTLVLRGPRERTFSNILNTAYPTTNVEMVNTCFSPEEVKMKISEISQNIAKRIVT